MSTAALPRHLLKWVLGLDLTYPIKHPKRDFANGFLLAEVLSKYFPDDIQMHSFENVASVKRKKSNWHVLRKFFKRYSIAIAEEDTEEVMAAASGAIVRVLQTIYEYVHEDPAAHQVDPDSLPLGTEQSALYSQSSSAQESLQQAMYAQQPQYPVQQSLQPGSHPYAEQLSQPYLQQPAPAYPPQVTPAQWQQASSAYRSPLSMPWQAEGIPAHAPINQWQQSYAAVQPFTSPQQPFVNQPSVSFQQPVASQQPCPQQQPYLGQQQYAFQQTYSTGQTQSTAPAMQFSNPYADQYQHGGPVQTAASAGAPSIEYDRRPRPIDYRPYTQQDYVSRNYDAKSQEYWQLGTLGAQIDNEDLQAKRRKAEELKELARSIREKNSRLASMSTATQRPKVETPKSKSAREKALEFARTVPVPERKQSASPDGSSGEQTPQPQQQQHRRSSKGEVSEIERLQAQHAEHRQKVESIRQEFMRMAAK